MQSDFVDNNIKGKIAEEIFAHMFREDAQFNVISSGFEVKYALLAENSKGITQKSSVLNQLRTMPDFILYSKDNDSTFIVEVRYRSKLVEEEVLEMAQKLKKDWLISFIFLITQDGFFYSSCTEIKKAKGKIEPLDINYISKKLQNKYIQYVKKYLGGK